MSRLRRPFLTDRFFFVTCNRLSDAADFTSLEFECLSTAIYSARKQHGFLLTAYVFLPDHWHAVIFPRHPLTISKAMEVIKVKSTRSIHIRRGDAGQVWQPRFFDDALRTVEKYHSCLDYIHMNPVRRGLVNTSEDWIWSSIHSYSALGEVKLTIDRVELPTNPQARL